MATKITFSCPECGATLSVSDRSKLGKKIKCPKCQEVFLPEVPDEAPNEDPDDLHLIEDDDDDDSSASRKPAGRGKSKKASSSGSGSKLPIVLGGVVGALLLVGAGLFFSGALGGNSAAPAPSPNQESVVVVPAQPAPTPPPATTTAAAPTQSIPTNSAPAKTEAAVTPPTTPAPKLDTKLSLQEKMLGLRWMASDTEWIVHAKPAEILQSQLLKGPLVGPMLASNLAEVKKKLGIGVDEIESVTIGVRGVIDQSVKTMKLAQEMKFDPSKQEQSPFIAIIRTKTPLELSAIAKLEPGNKIKEKFDKQYVESISDEHPPLAIWIPGQNTVIAGPPEDVFPTMERGETVAPRAEFQSIDQTQQFLIAAAVPDLEGDSRLKEFEDNPIFTQVKTSMKPYSLKMVNVGITVTAGIKLHVSALSSSADGMKMTKASLDSNLALARTMFDSYKPTAQPLFAELGEMLIANLKVEEKGNLVRASTSIPDSAKDKLEQVPAIVMMMAMSGAFGGPVAPAGSTMSMVGGKMVVVLPGETNSVDPKSAEGLEDGLKISIKSAWNPMTFTDTDGTVTQYIDVIVDLTGPGVEKICSISDLSITNAKLDGAGKLKRSKFSPSDSETSETLYPFDPHDKLSANPPQTARLKFSAEQPMTSAKKVAAFEGSFKYFTSENSTPKMIEDAPIAASRLLKDEELKAAEVRLRRSHSEVVPASLSLSCGKHFLLGKVTGAPGEYMVVTESEKDRTIQRVYTLEKSGKFRDDFELKFVLHSNITEHEVKFRFEDVPLPTPESKPQPIQFTDVAPATPGSPPASTTPSGNKPNAKNEPKGPQLNGVRVIDD